VLFRSFVGDQFTGAGDLSRAAKLGMIRQPGGREPVRAFLDGIDNKKELAQVLADLTCSATRACPALPSLEFSRFVSRASRPPV
jgi:hypothetical protein